MACSISAWVVVWIGSGSEQGDLNVLGNGALAAPNDELSTVTDNNVLCTKVDVVVGKNNLSFSKPCLGVHS